MLEDNMLRIVLAVIVGVLFGIVYSMRVLVLMERRVARIEKHIETLVQKALKQEGSILKAVRRAHPGKKSKKSKKRK